MPLSIPLINLHLPTAEVSDTSAPEQPTSWLFYFYAKAEPSNLKSAGAQEMERICFFLSRCQDACLENLLEAALALQIPASKTVLAEEQRKGLSPSLVTATLLIVKYNRS